MKIFACSLITLATALAAWAQPDDKGKSAPKFIEVDRLVLKNGSRLDGIVIGSNEDEVIVRVKEALVGIRKDLIIKREKVILRVRPEEPKPVAPVKPKETPDPKVKPAVAPPPTPKPTVKEPTPPAKPQTKITLKEIPDTDPAVGKKVEDLLNRMRQGTDNDKMNAAEELVRLGGDAQLYLVSSISVAPELSPWTLAAVGRIESTKAFPMLQQMIPQLNDLIKPLVFAVFGLRQYKEALGAIEPYLLHKDPMVRAAAVEAMAAMQSTDDFSKILESLGIDDETLATRVTLAIESLARIPEFKDEASRQLVEVVQRSDNLRARGQAAVISAKLAIPEIKPILVELLHHESALLRALIAAAMGELKDKELVEEIGSQLELEPDRDAKIQMVQALEKIKDRSAVPLLIRRLNDADDRVRIRVSAALTTITGQSFGESAESWQNWWDTDGKPR